MADVIMRRANAIDIEPAIAVWRASSTARRGGRPAPIEREERVRESVQRPGGSLFVADDAGQIVGMGLAAQGRGNDGAGPPVPGLCFIALIYVAPERWGEGLGGGIVEAVLAEARTKGFSRARLWTHADNARARRLYEGRGFRRTGREQADEQGALVVEYERTLYMQR